MPRVLASLAVLVLLAAGCGSSDTSSPGASGGTSISMKDTQFTPKELSVKVGQKVTWTNDDPFGHNVKADSGASFSSDEFGESGSYAFTPKQAGRIAYECTLHPGMTGILRVTS